MAAQSTPLARKFASLFALAAAAAFACGCHAGPTIERLDGAAPRDAAGTGTGAAGWEAAAGGSIARWRGMDLERALFDLRRAVPEAHWALLRAPSPGKVEPWAGEPRTMMAMLPDGREATIVALREAGANEATDATFAAAVRVGLFGDAQAEAAFLTTLDQLLRGEPARPRGKKFTLPE